MLRLLSKKLEQLHDQSVRISHSTQSDDQRAQAVPSRFPSPEPTLAPASLHIPIDQTMFTTDLAPGLDEGTSGGEGFSLPQQQQEGLFDFDVDVNFNLDGFWEDFTLGEGSGFPFR